MNQFIKRVLAVIIFTVLVLPSFARAEVNPVELYFFEGQGCQYCARMKSFLEGMKVDYPNLTVRDFEVYFDKENQDLFQKMATAYGAESRGVPTIFIGDEVIVGENYEKLKNAVEKCTLGTCPSPADKLAAAGSNVNSILNTNQPVDGQNEMVGWIIIGVVLALGIALVIFIIMRKK